MSAIRDVRLRSSGSAEPTLHLERMPGATLLLAVALVALMMAGAELLVRSTLFKAHVVASDWGSAHNQFELQLGRLQTLAAREGSVHCIFLGNSMVWRGFEPQTFARTVGEANAGNLRCFNFGVDGMPASGAAAVASILVQDYQPQILIYGTDPRDMAVSLTARDATVLLDTPWLRYRQGEFSPSGWLYEHVHLWRYRESLGYLLRLQKTFLFQPNPQDVAGEQYGFVGDNTVGDYVSDSPLQHQELGTVRYYLDLLWAYEMQPENARALQEIAGIDDADTQVIILEMPVPDTYLEFFSNGERDYRRWADEVERVAREYHVPFWRTRDLQLIASDGWVDYSHLNTKGARTFSRWLATELAEREALQR